MNKQEKLNQQQQIIDYVKTHGVITVRIISTKLFINSPTARLSELYKRGFVFDKQWMESEGSRYLEFRLLSEPQDKGVA
jgi:Mn-dependent DtxR family transcriptional regulator